MRLGTWTLAAIGCAGLALSVGFAAEPGESGNPYSNGETQKRSSYPYFNQNHKLTRPTTRTWRTSWSRWRGKRASTGRFTNRHQGG